LTGEWKILIGWVLFGGTHIFGSFVRVRRALIGYLGLRGFKALYSLVAIATFISLCLVYFPNRHSGTILFDTNPVLLLLAQLLMFFAVIILVQGMLTPGPIGTGPEMAKRVVFVPSGIHRITRHPQNISFVLFGLAHLIANPYRGDWLFFGGFVLFALVGSAHQDRRILAGVTGAGENYRTETSLLPFVAIVAGKQPLFLRELNVPGLGAAVILFLILRYFHSSLFGGFGG
jgi:uncharacterized membrane protein